MRVVLLFLLLSAPTLAQNVIERSYEWTYGGQKLGFQLGFSRALYEYYKKQPRVRTDYTAYVMDPQQEQLLGFIVTKFRAFAKQNRWSEPQTISTMIAFVQSLPYTSDTATAKMDEYPRYPVETLADNGGDCEDSSILLAALLKTMGYGVVLLQSDDHMAVGVQLRKPEPGMTLVRGYAYLETTGKGFEVGEYPKELSYPAQTFEVVPLAYKPLVDMDVKVKNGPGAAQLDISIRNQGSQAAQVFVTAHFETDSREQPQASRSQPFKLAPGNSGTLAMPAAYPASGKKVRLLVEAVDASNQRVLKQWCSQWVDMR
ncbi:MAG: hypothetical protein HY319_15740 [Armatimonadetes bacterium]|nr:hypothetical protein [Armatimonadota bacterium]